MSHEGLLADVGVSIAAYSEDDRSQSRGGAFTCPVHRDSDLSGVGVIQQGHMEMGELAKVNNRYARWVDCVVSMYCGEADHPVYLLLGTRHGYAGWDIGAVCPMCQQMVDDLVDGGYRPVCLECAKAPAPR